MSRANWPGGMKNYSKPLASVQNSLRPERRETPAKKRRPKSYQLLTQPRHEFQEIPHRAAA
jgi:hypothetical protein